MHSKKYYILIDIKLHLKMIRKKMLPLHLTKLQKVHGSNTTSNQTPDEMS